MVRTFAWISAAIVSLVACALLLFVASTLASAIARRHFWNSSSPAVGECLPAPARCGRSIAWVTIDRPFPYERFWK